MNLFKTILAKTLDIFYPKECISCGENGLLLCKKCQNKIRINENTLFKNKTKLLNQSIIKEIFVACPFHNNPILKKAIHLMKYKFYKDLAINLGELIANNILENEKFNKKSNNLYNKWQEAILVPIPLHKRKFRLRGFNQSFLLAKTISLHTDIPCDNNLLKRIKETKSQAKLTRNERIDNMREAFTLTSKASSYSKLTPIILVDDVCTTLSTIENAAKAFQKAGFHLILGAVIAHD